MEGQRWEEEEEEGKTPGEDHLPPNFKGAKHQVENLGGPPGGSPYTGVAQAAHLQDESHHRAHAWPRKRELPRLFVPGAGFLGP